MMKSKDFHLAVLLLSMVLCLSFMGDVTIGDEDPPHQGCVELKWTYLYVNQGNPEESAYFWNTKGSNCLWQTDATLLPDPYLQDVYCYWLSDNYVAWVFAYEEDQDLFGSKYLAKATHRHDLGMSTRAHYSVSAGVRRWVDCGSQ